MQQRAGGIERDDQGTDTVRVASLFAELERICADGSWEMPETPEKPNAEGGRKPLPRSRFWRWL